MDTAVIEITCTDNLYNLEVSKVMYLVWVLNFLSLSIDLLGVIERVRVKQQRKLFKNWFALMLPFEVHHETIASVD